MRYHCLTAYLVDVCCWHICFEAYRAPAVCGVGVLPQSQVTSHQTEQIAGLGERVLKQKNNPNHTSSASIGNITRGYDRLQCWRISKTNLPSQ
jgi:hypothetical protein